MNRYFNTGNMGLLFTGIFVILLSFVVVGMSLESIQKTESQPVVDFIVVHPTTTLDTTPCYAVATVSTTSGLPGVSNATLTFEWDNKDGKCPLVKGNVSVSTTTGVSTFVVEPGTLDLGFYDPNILVTNVVIDGFYCTTAGVVTKKDCVQTGD